MSRLVCPARVLLDGLHLEAPPQQGLTRFLVIDDDQRRASPCLNLLSHGTRAHRVAHTDRGAAARPEEDPCAHADLRLIRRRAWLSKLSWTAALSARAAFAKAQKYNKTRDSAATWLRHVAQEEQLQALN